MARRSSVVRVRADLTMEAAAGKAAELLEFAARKEHSRKVVDRLEEILAAANRGGATRIDLHDLTRMEREIKSTLGWKMEKLRDLLGAEATAPAIQGQPVRVDGVEWRNPVAFEQQYGFRCPRRLGDQRGMIRLFECQEHRCSCFAQAKALKILTEIHKRIEEEDAESEADAQPA